MLVSVVLQLLLAGTVQATQYSAVQAKEVKQFSYWYIVSAYAIHIHASSPHRCIRLHCHCSAVSLASSSLQLLCLQLSDEGKACSRLLTNLLPVKPPSSSTSNLVTADNSHLVDKSQRYSRSTTARTQSAHAVADPNVMQYVLSVTYNTTAAQSTALLGTVV